ncbi:DNA-directed RNA polymerase [Pelagophyceae sp. CCMP2097]|nr:DNA-directed RNA polymerase [Pelagophyceae sp. CCMP2097]|mmetsp:Transcript_27782/g.93385  ORF Transcript_27782/g.93385 Transcript_27782/m.93385 type:complete len:116 (-) Transcript_27782:57-404(-)
MNAPERHKRYLLDDGEKKMVYTKDQKLPNAGTFRINKEDHTVGNLLRMQLLRDDRVRFAGYQLPHPLEYHMLVKVQTHSDADTPLGAMKLAVDELSGELDAIDRNFREEVDKFKA